MAGGGGGYSVLGVHVLPKGLGDLACWRLQHVNIQTYKTSDADP